MYIRKILKLFKPKLKPKPEPIIIGSRWAFKSYDPWKKEKHKVTILDVKEGWVRYDMGGAFTDERMVEYSFRYCYEPVKPKERKNEIVNVMYRIEDVHTNTK